MLKLRDAEDSDFSEVIELHYSGLNESGSLSADKSLDEDLFNIEYFYDGKNNKLLLALNEDDKIVGMGAIKKISGTTCEIKRMRVASHSRRQGIAQKILNYLIEYAGSSLGARTLTLDTSVNQIAAQRLYEKNGFIKVKNKCIGGIPSIIYMKSLVDDNLEG
jgi:ribosomal protein S18 acetylase RimI-like enzyme